MSGWRAEYLTSIREADNNVPVNRDLIESCSQLVDRVSALEAERAALLQQLEQLQQQQQQQQQQQPPQPQPSSLLRFRPTLPFRSSAAVVSTVSTVDDPSASPALATAAILSPLPSFSPSATNPSDTTNTHTPTTPATTTTATTNTNTTAVAAAATTPQALARLRLDLAEALRARSSFETRLRAAETRLRTVTAQAAADGREVRGLRAERRELVVRLRDRDDELRAKAKLVADVQDELAVLNMQLDMVERRRAEKEAENVQLVERFMRRVGQEADAVNLENETERVGGGGGLGASGGGGGGGGSGSGSSRPRQQALVGAGRKK